MCITIIGATALWLWLVPHEPMPKNETCRLPEQVEGSEGEYHQQGNLPY